MEKKKIKLKKDGLLRNTWKNRALLMMILPTIILIILFDYVPMAGMAVAFKKFDYQKGIFGSPWVGLDNFRFLFVMKSLTWRMIRNTVGYYLLFTAVGTVCNIALAIALNECRSKYFAKYSHMFMIMPTFISYIAISYIVFGFLQHDGGALNNLLITWGKEPVSWYQEPKYWPAILTFVNVWQNTGYGSILYLSALAGMDQEVFEAATLDGASKWQQIRYITLPMLASMVSILLLMGLGGIMTSNTGLFYQVTRDAPTLYETTQTIDVYVMKAMISGTGDFGPSSAVSFFQSIVGSIMVIFTNLVVRKIAPENALF